MAKKILRLAPFEVSTKELIAGLVTARQEREENNKHWGQLLKLVPKNVDVDNKEGIQKMIDAEQAMKKWTASCQEADQLEQALRTRYRTLDSRIARLQAELAEMTEEKQELECWANRNSIYNIEKTAKERQEW